MPIVAAQCAVVAVYLFLLTVPAFSPLPARDARLFESLTLVAQFLFWGLWWPFVILITLFAGRLWCGVLCPEGAISEFASRHGLEMPIPRWIRWSGWPFVAFVATTVYGQLISVYEYPKAALLILGGSTVAAVAIGLVYGRGKRVWCRYLCPVSGVFGLLARFSALRFRVDRDGWSRAPRQKAVDCPTLVDIARMRSAAQCHLCGRCSGHRGSVALERRPLGEEVLALTEREFGPWETRLLIFGMIGLATGAYQWSASPWFVAAKQAIATWLIDRDSLWLLGNDVPWWLLTNYPGAHDVFTPLDGLVIVCYLAAAALLLGGWLAACLRIAAIALHGRRNASSGQLAYALVPFGGVGLFLGLSMLTATMLKAEGLILAWLPHARALLLALGCGWSLWLAWRISGLREGTTALRRAVCVAALAGGMLPALFAWVLLFYSW